MEDIIVLSQVSKTYKEKKAVADISFTIKKGTVTALLGPNGAGKTTTISMILGLMDPTGGSVKVFGKDPKDLQVRQRIGAMLQEVSVLDTLTVKELILLFQSYYPNPLSLEELIQFAGLEYEQNMRSEKLSGGQKRRLNFALALAGNPDLIFFDEPTVGMDVTSRRLFWEKTQSLARLGKTILFSTHYLEEADSIADRIMLFDRGRIIADGTSQQLKSRIVRRAVSFELTHAVSPSTFQALKEVESIEQDEDRLILYTQNTDTLLASLFQGKYPMKNINIEQGSLDQVFEELMTHSEEAV